MSELEEPTVDAPDESGSDDGGGETATETAERLYAGQYKTIEEFEKGHGEARATLTQSQQRAAELEAQIAEYETAMQQPAEEPYDPYSALAGQLDENSEQAWSAKLHRDPAGAMNDALRPESIQAFGPDLAERMYITWFGQQPLAAQMWAAQRGANQSKQELEDLRTQFQAEQRDRQQENIVKTATLAKDLVVSNLPDFANYRDRVLELFEIHQLPDEHPLLQTPEGQAEFTRQMYQIARGEEFDRQQQAAAAGEEPTPAKPAGARARTQTRSSASGNAGSNDPVTQALLDAQAFAGQTK